MARDLKYGRVTLEHGTIGDDEPVVVFRAQDKLLPAVLSYYQAIALREGSPEKHLKGIEAARADVEEWQGWNRTQVPQSAESNDGSENPG
jgi:hypothetical protein